MYVYIYIYIYIVSVIFSEIWFMFVVCYTGTGSTGTYGIYFRVIAISFAMCLNYEVLKTMFPWRITYLLS